jgi:drug/metabolite transporter (DMT)-like permease
MLMVRFGVVALVLAAVLLVTRGSLRPARGEAWWLVVLGALGYAPEAVLFFLGLERGTAATVVLLFYTYPVLVTLLTMALGLGRPGLLVVGALVAAVAGAALVVGTSGGLDITAAGIAFSFGSALTFSIYLVTADRTIRRTAPLVSALWVGASASASLAAFSAATGGIELPKGEAIGFVGAMGALTAAAFVFLFLGLRRLGAVRTAIVASLEPVAAAVLAWVFLGEVLRGGALAGGILILTGAIAASLARGIPDPELAIT